MGLTNKSVGLGAIDGGIRLKKRNPDEKIIAIAGNPNVGKSSIFNALTGMNQHTGNWPGKTVSNAIGRMNSSKYSYTLVDIPGTYSLIARSAEEEVARNFICFGDADATVVVCDATCLERNLNLLLQIIEISPKTIVCVNLLDEAKRKKISVDLNLLSDLLGVPVIGTVAKNKKTLSAIKKELDEVISEKANRTYKINYPEIVEEAISITENAIITRLGGKINSRWLALKLLDYDESLINEINCYFEKNILSDEKIVSAIKEARKKIEYLNLEEIITTTIFKHAEEIAQKTVKFGNKSYNSFDKRIDRILTGKWLGFPLMILLLAFIFWLTISAANYPSALLSKFFDFLTEHISEFVLYLNFPAWLHSLIIDGILNVLTWVIAVMLPPMAIFFPLFTLLEDVGYLPRIAYNLDKPFKKCSACGKQALTMCMGFGCNAAGVVGCRIINTRRERLIAIITNSLVPCNGRFPMLIALITMYFAFDKRGVLASLSATAILSALIILGVFMTFISSKLLSLTLLKGEPSSFVLELPPYRKPQMGKVIIRSIFDRTLFVLGRAAAVAAPAGIIIWIFANVEIGNFSLLSHCCSFLDPFAKMIGLDGVILMAFILGFPANEIVLPLIIMAYQANGVLTDYNSLLELKMLFLNNGWTATTALCTMIFSMFHWPCSTTVLTIKKETGSFKWTAVSMILPTLIGMLICFIIASLT